MPYPARFNQFIVHVKSHKNHQKAYTGSIEAMLQWYESMQVIKSFLRAFVTEIYVVASLSINIALTPWLFFRETDLKVAFDSISPLWPYSGWALMGPPPPRAKKPAETCFLRPLNPGREFEYSLKSYLYTIENQQNIALSLSVRNVLSIIKLHSLFLNLTVRFRKKGLRF